jgi:hypothetical protein
MTKAEENIIFLDFDGVIVHSEMGKKGMDRVCVLRVNQAAYLTKAKIAVHSTWVYVNSKDSLFDMLKEAGLMVEYLHKDWICYSEMREKPDAISTWLVAHPEVKKYVVVDDEKMGDHPLVQIRDGWLNGGIQNGHIEEIVRVMGLSKDQGQRG